MRVGKDKTPVGYELLMGDGSLFFPERALASSLVPNRDIGVQALGDVAGGTLSYAAGVFNGVPDGASTTTEVDTTFERTVFGDAGPAHRPSEDVIVFRAQLGF